MFSLILYQGLNGLVVWFLLRVQEVPGSNPGWAQFFLKTKIYYLILFKFGFLLAECKCFREINGRNNLSNSRHQRIYNSSNAPTERNKISLLAPGAPDSKYKKFNHIGMFYIYCENHFFSSSYFYHRSSENKSSLKKTLNWKP